MTRSGQLEAPAPAGVHSSFAEAVLTLTLSHPGKRNSLTTRMYAQLADAIARAAGDDSVRAVVIRGDDDGGGFAAGTDIASFADFSGAADGLAYERRVGEILSALQDLTVPTIAEVRGAAV